jgi:hypothetical protein
MNKKNITFVAENRHTMEVKLKPVPATSIIPEWWKEMPVFSGGRLDLNPAATVTAKKCAPLLDGISFGYIVELWSDVLVTQENGEPYIKWATNEPVFMAWDLSQSKGFEIPSGFSNTVFKYFHGWVIKTPPGYSCLITHPSGYQNLPFRTLTGIVDTDILNTKANSPIVIKKDFEGIIKKGTPMFQILPFKREEWEMKFELMNDGDAYINNEKLMTKIVSSYSSSRAKKKFN